jgi:hypothetical protein
MKSTVNVNRLRSGIMSMLFISHIIEVTFVIFLSIFLLGPAIFFIITGLFCAVLFFRPHWIRLLGVYKFLFRLEDEDFYLHELPLNFGFWLTRSLMVILVLGQITVGIYYLSSYGFLNQNLIYLLAQL